MVAYTCACMYSIVRMLAVVFVQGSIVVTGFCDGCFAAGREGRGEGGV